MIHLTWDLKKKGKMTAQFEGIGKQSQIHLEFTIRRKAISMPWAYNSWFQRRWKKKCRNTRLRKTSKNYSKNISLQRNVKKGILEGCCTKLL